VCVARHGYGRNRKLAAFCRDCLGRPVVDAACPACGSSRVTPHPSSKPVHSAFWIATPSTPPSKNATILAQGQTLDRRRADPRGVVSTACYIARRYGVRSAMPMFQAIKLCPEAVILKPRHAYYSQVASQTPRLDGRIDRRWWNHFRWRGPISTFQAQSASIIGRRPEPWQR